MTLTPFHHQPTVRELRQFGYLCVVMLPLVGWLWGVKAGTIIALTGIGLAMAGLASVAPQWLKPIFVTLLWITAPIGMVISELMLALFYYAVICPIGVLFRMLGRDALQQRADREAESYWQPKPPPKDAASYYRQF